MWDWIGRNQFQLLHGSFKELEDVVVVALVPSWWFTTGFALLRRWHATGGHSAAKYRLAASQTYINFEYAH